MRLSLRFCVLGHHSPRRAEVRWDGLHFIGTCRHCSKHIRRKAHHKWLRDWLQPERVS